ncbi:MAG: single-stranded-DNA-specific exonuclease RecJ [Planctomycetes bacterium]|nr:single-stranded-DNA-specific exonuclease RecJ [Planctomycetota bacterium]
MGGASEAVGQGISGKRWVVARPPREACEGLAAALGTTSIAAALLWNRGVRDAEEGLRFLQPALAALHDPDAFPQMGAAVERIARAVAGGERIAIYGDYDVDGISATALLLDLFDIVRVPVDVYLPHRVEEGYGLNAAALDELARRGVSLVITVDTGTGMAREIAHGRARGLSFVITDHHEAACEETPADAHLNPKTEPSIPFRDLAGVGVAFKLAWAVSRRFSRARKVSPELRAFLRRALGYVALGTVADVCPLRDENRTLVAHGLRELEAWDRPGIRALREVACPREGSLTASTLAFRIGPRLNAAGRMGRADLALELLRTDDPDRAREIARHLDRENRRRQDVERRILEEARDRIAREFDLSRARGIVLADPAWHAGVIGIVAARIAEHFQRPTILISLAGERGRGSGRSIPRIHLRDALASCREHLIGFGGHAQAAGIAIDASRVDAFREAFDRAIPPAGEETGEALEIDAEIGLDALCARLIADVDRLAPFGEGNPAPVFFARDLEVVGTPRSMGRASDHLSFYVRQNGVGIRVVAFGRADLSLPLARAGRCDVVFRPALNTFHGERTIEMRLVDIRLP